MEGPTAHSCRIPALTLTFSARITRPECPDPGIPGCFWRGGVENPGDFPQPISPVAPVLPRFSPRDVQKEQPVTPGTGTGRMLRGCLRNA